MASWADIHGNPAGSLLENLGCLEYRNTVKIEYIWCTICWGNHIAITINATEGQSQFISLEDYYCLSQCLLSHLLMSDYLENVQIVFKGSKVGIF